MEPLKRKRIHFRRHPLYNGLILLVAENHRLPLISMNAFVLAGSDQNPLDRPGIAALTSRLVTEGTRNYGVHEIYEIVENTGGNLTTFSERELSGISLVTPSQDLGLGLDLLQEILTGPTFPEDRFQLEKKNVLSQLQAMGTNLKPWLLTVSAAGSTREVPCSIPFWAFRRASATSRSMISGDFTFSNILHKARFW